ncbi:hypothetical protein, partial [Streptomyces cinnamoneus]|uniref:hypothetical protein n=1 Tax=Streptomyces cinnamoneus TaxID=53446 RepID=UPI0019606C06
RPVAVPDGRGVLLAGVLGLVFQYVQPRGVSSRPLGLRGGARGSRRGGLPAPGARRPAVSGSGRR